MVRSYFVPVSLWPDKHKNLLSSAVKFTESKKSSNFSDNHNFILSNGLFFYDVMYENVFRFAGEDKSAFYSRFKFRSK